jgi:tetratricopeptide (TPR) repeat protein
MAGLIDRDGDTMSRLFLSHSSANNAEAVAIRDWLASEGWNEVFLDLDPVRGIAAGERWERALNEAASRCEAVLFLISHDWLNSRWCLKEFNLARRLNKRLFGVLIEATTLADLPADLTGTWQVIDLASGQDHRMFRVTVPHTQEEVHVTFSQEGLTRLRNGLAKAGLDPRFFAWPPEQDPDRPPYRGLKPLEAEDAGIFFGRDAPIVEALDTLRGLKEAAPPRLLVILGASGAGKSSFLRAGLLPRLARDDRNFLPLPVIRPERAVISGETGLLHALEATFSAQGLPQSRASLREAISGGAESLRPLLQKLVDKVFATLLEESEAKRPVVVLAIDQAEELFLSEGADESEALLALIRDLAGQDCPGIIVLFAIRSDSYDRLETTKVFEGMRQQTLPLLPIPRGAYQMVIEGPAARLREANRNLTIAPQLTQRLLEDIEKGSGSDALPLLAFTLEQLYVEYGGARTLKLADYEAFSGIRGAIEASVNRALKVADSDPRIPRDQDARLGLLRRGLIPWLAGIDPETGSPRRRVARLADIPAEAEPLIHLLVEQRLLATDRITVREGKKEKIEVTIEPAHEALRHSQAAALTESSMTLLTLGDTNGALAAAKQAQAIMQNLLAIEPDNADWQRGLSVSNGNIGEVLEAQGKLEEALAAYRDSLTISKALVAKDASNTEWQRDVSVSAGKIGDVLKAQGKLEEALAAYRDSLTIAKALVAKDPSNTDWQSDLSSSDNKIGDVLKAQGKLEEALAAYRDGLAIVKALVAKDPSNTEWQLNLSVSDDRIGDVLKAHGKLEEALAAYRDSLAIRKALVAKDPSNTDWQRGLAASNEEIGEVLEAQGRLDEALAAYRDSLTISKALVAKDASNTEWQRDVSVSDEKIGEVLEAQGQLEEALAAYRDILAIAKALVAKDASNVNWQRNLLLSHGRIGDVLMAQGKLDEALAAYRDSLAIAKALVAKDASNTEWQRDVSVSDGRIGVVLEAQGKLDEALAAYRDSLAIAKALVAKDPSNTDWQSDLSYSDERIGGVLVAQGKLEEALAAYRDSLAIRKALVATKPDNADWQLNLAVSNSRIGDVLKAQGQLDEALAAYRDSLAIRKALVATKPDNADWQLNLAVSNSRIGDVLKAQGQLEEALAAYRDSLAIRKALVAKDASNADWQSDLQSTIEEIGGLAYNFVLAHDFATALEATDEAISLAPDNIWLYTNRAHALMFLGRVDEARALYLQYRGTKNVLGEKSWELAILDDFADLRKAGLTNPLMDEIEKQFTAAG